MNRQEVEFLITMVMSELQEIADTVTSSNQESLELMRSCLGVDQSEHPGSPETRTEVELIADQADGGVDAWIYILNAFCKKGVDLLAIFEVVHRANMAKRDPSTGKFLRRESDGKVIKPPGWQPPDIENEIRRQMENPL